MRRLALLDRNAPEDPVLASLQLPGTFDWLARTMAAVLVVVTVGGGLLLSDGNDWVNIPGTLLCVLPWFPWIAGRVEETTWWVSAGVLVATAALAIPDLLNGDDTLGFGPQFSQLFPFLVLFGYIVAPRRRATVVVAAALTVTFVRALAQPEPQYTLPGWLIPAGLTVAGMIGIRIGAIEIARGQRKIAALEAEQERRDVAREVHAAVAHTLNVTLLHVATARAAIRRACSSEAVEALEEAERHGRSSLADVRRIIRLLRAPDDTALDSAQPDLADVGILIADYRTAGWPVSLRIHGDVGSVPASTGLAMYRVLQEALANAAHHGDGPADVHLRVSAGHVDARVTNPVRNGHTGRPGAGITRMRERAEAAGGELVVSAVDGCWKVSARLPCDRGAPG